jgi:lysophospholipase
LTSAFPVSAPLFNTVAEGPQDGQGVWLTTADGKRLRAGFWNASGMRGTVVLLPGRSEYVEKYGRTAAALAGSGYATLTIDWRGQGMSDRALADPLVGHVMDFAEYQDDLDTLLNFARAQGLPQPFHLLAHSMGGTIGLRALVRGVPFQTAAFSGPMWGIMISPAMRPLATVLSAASGALRFNHRYVLGTGPAIYVIEAPFEGNTLTTNPDMWDYMRRQALAYPDLSLGGPSFGWLHAALTECRALAHLPSPVLPTLCVLGSREKIVDPKPILTRMPGWKNGRLRIVQESEHEVLMERPVLRDAFLSEATTLFGQ